MTTARPTLRLAATPPRPAAPRAVLTLANKPAPAAKAPPPPPTPAPPSPEEKAARAAAHAALEAEQRRAAANRRREELAALERALRAAYPAIFPARCLPPSPPPLKVGIYRDLRVALAGGRFSAKLTATFLAEWCRRVPYVQAIAAGEPRRDLSGAQVAVPTERERKLALEELRQRGVTSSESTLAAAG
jgi:hypothetical protein